MKVFISIPTEGRSIWEIREDDTKAMDAIRKIFCCEDELEMLNDIDREAPSMWASDLWCLGRAIIDIGSCDAVYFCPGWEKSKKCQAEHRVCELYDIQRIEA